MKYLIALVILFSFFQGLAQPATGKVIDSTSRRPVPNATLTIAGLTTFSRTNGTFSFFKPGTGDSILVSCIGYRSRAVFPHDWLREDTLRILLQPLSVLLNGVTIRASRNYHLDSTTNRRDFEGSFNYKGPRLKDAFMGRSLASTPYGLNQAPNNTTELFSVNLLTLLAVAGKNKTPEAKFQKILLRDEQASYVDHVFSHESVSKITALKGDSLQDFMDLYRPGISELRKMSPYDLMSYIKRNYIVFMKTYRHQNNSPFKP